MTDLEQVAQVAYDPALDPFTPLYAEREAAREAELLRLHDQLTAVRATLETARQEHRDDIAKIGAALIYAANHRDEERYDIDGENGRWCGEYDAVIAELNRDLFVELPVRMHDYVVYRNVRVGVRVSAANRSGAENAAVERISEARQAMREMDGVEIASDDDYYASYEIVTV